MKNHAPEDESYLDKTDLWLLPDDKTEGDRRGERGEQHMKPTPPPLRFSR
ncbi:MAG: hypothetical protein ACREVA_11200 [Burkholderiales bacterium]